MNGLIALVGSGEYLTVMQAVDRFLLDHCNAGPGAARVICLPTAAGREGDQSISRWMRMGEDHFRALGADARSLRLIDRDDAENPHLAETIAQADLIYFSGGNPAYLYQTLQGSRAWQAVEEAQGRGAVLAGCSAGAMVLGRRIPDLGNGMRGSPAFAKIGAENILPHFDRFRAIGRMLLGMFQPRLKDGMYLLGIDETTALVGKPGAEWQVMGPGKVHIIRRKESTSYSSGERILLPEEQSQLQRAP